MAETLPADAVREILLRVPTDAATLFRCAATCKLWKTVVADPSFLRHHWPERARHPGSLLGFFSKACAKRHPPFFYPASPPGGPALFGARRRRRSLTSFVFSGAPVGTVNGAVPLASRGGLLLVRLPTTNDSLHLAVCDLLTGTCDVLPPLECRVSQCGCVVLPREDCWSSLHEQQEGHGTPLATAYSTFFKVLAVVIGRTDQDCNLYTFSSSSTGWSEPRSCLYSSWQRDAFAPKLLLGPTKRAAVCHGVAHWLGSYSLDQRGPAQYFTFGVNVKTGQISIAKISTPMNQLAPSGPLALGLSVEVDGRLSLLLQEQDLRLNIWTCGNDGTWLRTRVIGLVKPRMHQAHPALMAILSGEKNGALLMADWDRRVYRIDPETGVMEDVTMEMFQGSLSAGAVPIEIDWPALFMSRLAK